MDDVRQGGNLALAAERYAEAARVATNVAERDHLTLQAARCRDQHR